MTTSTISQVVLNGDLSNLTDDERLNYYNSVCESLGLNPLTKPFAFIKLNGKLTMYALKDCTEQLRTLHHVSITIAARDTINGVHIVTARASLPSGRCDESTGAVTIDGLKGENLSNAIMKAETKAKRRATLSICGLGMLDESEADSIPREPVNTPAPAFQEFASADSIKRLEKDLSLAAMDGMLNEKEQEYYNARIDATKRKVVREQKSKAKAPVFAYDESSIQLEIKRLAELMKERLDERVLPQTAETMLEMLEQAKMIAQSADYANLPKAWCDKFDGIIAQVEAGEIITNFQEIIDAVVSKIQESK